MNAGAEQGGDEESLESIPAQLGRKANAAVGKAAAQSAVALADLESKTNEVINKAQGALDKFADTVYSTKRKVVTGIDTAIGAVETPLLALAPILRETANTALDAVFGAVQGIPEMVQQQITSIKDPLIEGVQSQVDAIAEAAVAEASAMMLPGN